MSVRLLDKDGETALDVATNNGHSEVVALLRRHMLYQSRRIFMIFLSDYQFLQPPSLFRRESNIEKVLVTEDLHRYLLSFL